MGIKFLGGFLRNLHGRLFPCSSDPSSDRARHGWCSPSTSSRLRLRVDRKVPRRAPLSSFRRYFSPPSSPLSFSVFELDAVTETLGLARRRFPVDSGHRSQIAAGRTFASSSSTSPSSLASREDLQRRESSEYREDFTELHRRFRRRRPSPGLAVTSIVCVVSVRTCATSFPSLPC